MDYHKFLEERTVVVQAQLEAVEKAEAAKAERKRLERNKKARERYAANAGKRKAKKTEAELDRLEQAVSEAEYRADHECSCTDEDVCNHCDRCETCKRAAMQSLGWF